MNGSAGAARDELPDAVDARSRPGATRSSALAMAVTITTVAVALSGCSAPTGYSSGASDTPAAGATTQGPPDSVSSAQGWIAYQGLSDEGPVGVFLVRPDGTDDHEILLDVPGRRQHPDYSPDGTMLAFDAQDGGPDETWVAAADGSSPRLVAGCETGCYQAWEPAWSPDGTQLALATTRSNSGSGMMMGIAIVDVATGTATQIIEHPSIDGQDHFPRWSPDSTQLVFWRGSAASDGGDTAVYTVGVDGTGLTQLTDDALVAGDPDFSPDGARILFTTHPLLQYQEAGQSELYTMATDGTDQQLITDYGDSGPRATQPRWTPDGTAIVYIRTNQDGQPRTIYAMSPDGTDDGPVAATKPVYTHPVLQPSP